MAELQGLGALLPQEVWGALLEAGTERPFAAGEVLVRQGEPGTHVLLLTAGIVKVTRFEPNGEELLLALRGPGEAIGEMAVLDGTVRSANVIAVGSCATRVVGAARFRRLVDELGAQDVVMRHILGRFREGEDARAELAELPAGARLARVLCRLADAVGGARPVLDLSQEELARAMGLSRSAVAAELAPLRRNGVVSTGRRRLTVQDRAVLRALAEKG